MVIPRIQTIQHNSANLPTPTALNLSSRLLGLTGTSYWDVLESSCLLPAYDILYDTLWDGIQKYIQKYISLVTQRLDQSVWPIECSQLTGFVFGILIFPTIQSDSVLDDIHIIWLWVCCWAQQRGQNIQCHQIKLGVWQTFYLVQNTKLLIYWAPTRSARKCLPKVTCYKQNCY